MKSNNDAHEDLVDRVLALANSRDPINYISIAEHVEFRASYYNGEIDVLVRMNDKFYGFEIKSKPVKPSKGRVKVQAQRFYNYFGYNSRFIIVYPINNILTFRTIPPNGGFYNDQTK